MHEALFLLTITSLAAAGAWRLKVAADAAWVEHQRQARLAARQARVRAQVADLREAGRAMSAAFAAALVPAMTQALKTAANMEAAMTRLQAVLDAPAPRQEYVLLGGPAHGEVIALQDDRHHVRYRSPGEPWSDGVATVGTYTLTRLERRIDGRLVRIAHTDDWEPQVWRVRVRMYYERDGWVPFGSPLQERQTILRMARRAGVQVASLRTEYHWNYLTKNLDLSLVARGATLHPLER